MTVVMASSSLEDERPGAVSMVETIMEKAVEELDGFKSSIKAETFQRARLAAQLRQTAAEAFAFRAAEECRLTKEAEEGRRAEEVVAATEERLAKEVEKGRLAAAAAARASSIKAETFQRSRLAAQVRQVEVERNENEDGDDDNDHNNVDDNEDNQRPCIFPKVLPTQSTTTTTVRTTTTTSCY
jgi:hypothetical protein